MKTRRLIAALVLPALAAGLGLATPASAAPSYDACSHTITSLPVVITTQGNWCLKSDVATSISSGVAISIQANNVVLDCNGFKVGGLAAGLGTMAEGIVTMKLNTVIRDCHVRGFRIGVGVVGSAGTVEDNRIEGNTTVGIQAGSGTIIRRNRVLDTGGAPGETGYGIIVSGSGEVAENHIDGTLAGEGSSNIGRGIYATSADGLVIRDNIVEGIHGITPWPIIVYSGTRVAVTGNVVFAVATGYQFHGIDCPNGGVMILRDNTVFGPTAEDSECTDSGGNWFN